MLQRLPLLLLMLPCLLLMLCLMLVLGLLMLLRLLPLVHPLLLLLLNVHFCQAKHKPATATSKPKKPKEEFPKGAAPEEPEPSIGGAFHQISIRGVAVETVIARPCWAKGIVRERQ